MGKYASRDGSSSVAWADITGKPATFTPAVHSNTAHSETYITAANPRFTGSASVDIATPAGKFHVAGNGGSDNNIATFSTSDFVYASTGSGLNISTGAATGNTYTKINALSAGFTAWNSLVLQSGGGTLGIGFLSALAKCAINGGLHVGGESDPGDNNILADGKVTGASLNTPNWTIDEDGSNNGIVKYQGTTVGRVTVPVAGKSDLLMTGGIGCYQAL